MQGSDQLIVDRLAEIKKCLKAVDTLNAGEMVMLKMLIKYPDRRKKELQAEMQQIYDQDVALLHELQTQLKTRQSELKEMTTTLKSHEKNSIELFVAAKRVCSQLVQLQFSLQQTRGKMGYQKYSIVQDMKMASILQDRGCFCRADIRYKCSVLIKE